MVEEHPLSLRALLAIPAHGIEVLVAHGLDRTIRFVHASEMADPGQYLEGGEVVLTAGLWYLHGTPAATFAEELAMAGALAIGFGVNPSVPDVPPELVAACRRHRLTLFRVPPGVPFLAIATSFVERYVALSERRFASELFDLVLAGDGQHAAVAARLRAFGIDPDGPLVALHARADEQALGAVETVLRHAGIAAVAAPHGDGITIAAAWVDGEVAALARELHLGIGDTPVGAGSIARDARGLRRSVIEARHACTFAGRRRDVGYATHDAVASSAMLLAIQDDGVLDAFRGLLRPVVDHDAARGTSLVATLEAFLTGGARYAETAALLHVHVNTLRKRLERVESLTGRDLSRTEDVVDLYLALGAARGQAPSDG
jgi:DNA-binding PucR family transcriptional regulator